MNIRGKRIFLSGPMTGRCCYNVAAFATAHARLKEAGAGWVYNPAIAYLQEHGKRAEAKGHADYMADCLHELTRRMSVGLTNSEYAPMKYDLLVSIPGWEESAGARFEREAAQACGIATCDLGEVLA